MRLQYLLTPSRSIQLKVPDKFTTCNTILREGGWLRVTNALGPTACVCNSHSEPQRFADSTGPRHYVVSHRHVTSSRVFFLPLGDSTSGNVSFQIFRGVPPSSIRTDPSDDERMSTAYQPLVELRTYAEWARSCQFISQNRWG